MTPAPAFCKEKAETGPCRGAMPRFAFSKETSKCERFTYGGCEGNKNNFVDVEQCQKVCGDGTKVIVTSVPLHNLLLLLLLIQLKDRSSGDKTTEKPDKAPAIPVLDGAEKHAASFEDRSNDNSATTTLKSSVVDKMDVKSPSGLVGGIGG